MTRGRLEAFSDAVIAIVMTIMVLELVPPHGATFGDLGPLVPVFVAYVQSFVMLAVYWNNHHHLLQAARTVNGRVLWANMLLLFWLSLVPFGTAWIGQTSFAPIPMVCYGVILLMAAFSYFFLVRALIGVPGQNELIAAAIATDVKGKISPAVYALAIPLALVVPLASLAMYLAVGAMWIVPDPRIERRISS